jgi:hypothetical protein
MTLKVRFPHREVLDLVGILQENTFCFLRGPSMSW